MVSLFDDSICIVKYPESNKDPCNVPASGCYFMCKAKAIE